MAACVVVQILLKFVACAVVHLQRSVVRLGAVAVCACVLLPSLLFLLWHGGWHGACTPTGTGFMRTRCCWGPCVVVCCVGVCMLVWWEQGVWVGRWGLWEVGLASRIFAVDALSQLSLACLHVCM